MTMILIVSENPEFRSAMRGALATDSFEFVEARDGLAALQYAVEEAPEAIVLDEAIEGLRATRLRDHLASERETKSIPLWIVSNQDLLESATQIELAMTSVPPMRLRASG